jgi:hypothetical protein
MNKFAKQNFLRAQFVDGEYLSSNDPVSVVLARKESL